VEDLELIMDTYNYSNFFRNKKKVKYFYWKIEIAAVNLCRR